MDKAHDVRDISFDGATMHLTVDGKPYDVDLAVASPRLAAATQAERENVDISPSGYGIHWPGVNEDLTVNGLVGARQPPSRSHKRILTGE